MCTYGEDRPQFGLTCPTGETSSLRERIASVITREFTKPGTTEIASWAWSLADAIIAELDLTEDAGVIVGCAHG